jgi:hypothetical protein
MLLNARNNLFEFHFPKTFMPKKISDKYRGYLNRIPGNVIEEPLDFINYTIQGVNLPGMGFDAVEQDQKPGRKVQFRNTLPTQELFQKELTVTLQLVDGFVNYWMMLEILNYYYAFDTKEPFLDDLNMRMLDGEGNSIVTARLKRPLLKNISELSMSFASNVADFTTFDITIGYNELEVVIELD